MLSPSMVWTQVPGSKSSPAGSISTAEGSALVQLGDTMVMCGVKAAIAEPELDLPEHGFLGK